MKRLSRAVTLVGLLSAAACSDPNASGATGSSGSGTGTSSDAAPSASGIGVADCEAYITRMRKCVAEAPEAERSARMKAVDDSERVWLEKAQTGAEGKAMLVTPCKAALKQLDEAGYCK